jgi:hypothetical protein
MTATSNGADLQQLMMIADRYAHKLVADAAPPARVLMLVRDGEIECVILDDPDRHPAAQVRRLLAERRATLAAVLFEAEHVVAGVARTVFCILGETDEGSTAVRHYRVGRRRLMPLTGGGPPDVEGQLRPLFPVHRKPLDMDDVATPAASADAAIDQNVAA